MWAAYIMSQSIQRKKTTHTPHRVFESQPQARYLKNFAIAGNKKNRTSHSVLNNTKDEGNIPWKVLSCHDLIFVFC